MLQPMRPQVSGASWQSRTAPKAVIRADLIKIAATTKTRSTVNERPQKQRWKQQQQQQQQLKLVCTGLAASLLLCGHASAEEAAAIFAGKCIGKRAKTTFSDNARGTCSSWPPKPHLHCITAQAAMLVVAMFWQLGRHSSLQTWSETV